MNTATLSDVQNFMDRITTTPERTPGRFLVYGDGGLGKTSWAAYSRNPIFAMSRGETGLETLINSGQISPTPSISLEKWEESEQFVDWLLNERHDYGTLVFDAINGFEHMLYEHVCNKDYGGVWTGGKDSFMSWYQGHRHATTYWSAFFDKLDELRKNVICLSSCCAISRLRTMTILKEPITIGSFRICIRINITSLRSGVMLFYTSPSLLKPRRIVVEK